MSELKRDIGCGLDACWEEAMGCFSLTARENPDCKVFFHAIAFERLVAFGAYVQTELASRQRLEPLPALKETEVKLAPAPISEDLKNTFESNPD